jgi:hypothetical protein
MRYEFIFAKHKNIGTVLLPTVYVMNYTHFVREVIRLVSEPQSKVDLIGSGKI